MRKSPPIKVVFVDDNNGFLEECRERFDKGAPAGSVSIRPHDREGLRKAIIALDQARLAMRKRRPIDRPEGAELFDNADIVFVDYELFELQETTALTGEDIAYLLRCFSSCGVIVLLNPPDLGTSFFDLRLRSPFESWADLVLGSEQLGESWLWVEKPSGFAPWLWPNLPDAVRRRRQQVKDAEAALDLNVLELVGIPSEARIAMDHTMCEPVAVSSRNEFYSVRDFVLHSNYCIHRKDNKNAFGKDEKRLAQIGASRLSMWLEHVVLPAQTVLIDAPHLVSRLPGLLAGSPNKKATWNAVCRRDLKSMDGAIDGKKVKSFLLKKDHWLSRPAWLWPLIAGDASYSEWASIDSVPLVFCEDTSAFVDREKAQRFVADVPSPAGFRFVEKPKASKGSKQPDYRPSVRLSM